MKADLKFPLLFLMAGLLWVGISNEWLYAVPLSKEQQHLLSNIKDFVLVLLSSLTMYYLILKNNQKLLRQLLHLRQQTAVNKRLFEVLDMVENYILFTNDKGEVIWINQAMENHTGHALMDIKGRNASALLQGPETSEQARQQINDAIKSKTHCTVEILNYKKSGETYWINLHMAPLFNNNAELTGFLSLQSDITQHRTLEKTLLEQLTLLKKITWMTSHDIRRPLASIMALAQLMKKGNPIDNAECLPLLLQSADDLDQIIGTVTTKISDLNSLKNS